MQQRTVELIEADIADLHHKQVQATSELARLKATRRNLLLDLSAGSDAKLDAHDAAIVKANRAFERSTSAIEALTAELTTVRSQEAADEERRQAIYDRGLAAAEEYRRLASSDYPRLADEIATVMTRMGTLARLCDQALYNLPAGALAKPVNIEGRFPLRVLVNLPDFWESGRRPT